MNSASALNNGTEGPARWSLRLFGGFELSALPGGERVILPGKRERVLLAYLALSPNGRQQRRKLATLLWGDASDETALDNLRTCVWGLRKALGDTEHRAIASEGEDIVLDAAAFEIDALVFRRHAARSERTELEVAANLYSGELLDGLGIENDEFESWRRAETTRYRDQAIDVLTRLMTQLGACGETERAIEMGLRILRLEPLHEAAIRRLMRLYGESGRRGPAIQLYRTLADALKTELGAQPDAETRAVFAEIVRGDEDLTSDAPATDTKPLAVSTIAVRPSDAPGESSPLAQQSASADSAPRQIALQRVKTSKLNWILAGGLAAVIAIFLFYQFAPSAGTTTAQQESAKPAGAISIAVLPFENLSGDASQEFFSDGMTEEITAALAKIPGLRVVARTSAFQFKAQNRDIQSIGQQLHATHFIEGSVRKEGGRVRVTAQLVKADDGIGLWTDNYDRELKEIFATQEDIAQAIASALRVPLGLKQGESLVPSRTANLDSYQDYLRAKALVRARGPREPGGPLTEAAKLLERAVARDPNYAPSWAVLAQAYSSIPAFSPAFFNSNIDELQRIGADLLPKAEAAAQQAFRLDASTDGYTALAAVSNFRGIMSVQTADLFEQALSLDPGNPDALNIYSNTLASAGRLKKSLELRQRLAALEPFVPVFNSFTAQVFWANGRNDDAIALLKSLPPNAAFRDSLLAQIYAAEGRYDEAADALLMTPASGPYLPGIVETAARLLRTAPARAASPQTLPRLGLLNFIYLYIGAPERALEPFETVETAAGRAPPAFYLWHASASALRKTERFKAFVRKAGRPRRLLARARLAGTMPSHRWRRFRLRMR